MVVQAVSFRGNNAWNTACICFSFLSFTTGNEMIRYRTRIAKNLRSTIHLCVTARSDMGDGQTGVLSFRNWRWADQINYPVWNVEFKGDLDFQFLVTHSSSLAFREKWAHEKHPESSCLNPTFHFTREHSFYQLFKNDKTNYPLREDVVKFVSRKVVNYLFHSEHFLMLCQTGEIKNCWLPQGRFF